MNNVMANTNLQQIYERAVATVQNHSAPKLPARKAPIFQRAQPRTEREAVKDAANALSALWKMNPQAARS